MSAPFSLCKKIHLLNSLCFPCLEKLTAKFPVFPVPWPPCYVVNAVFFKYQYGKFSLMVLEMPVSLYFAFTLQQVSRIYTMSHQNRW